MPLAKNVVNAANYGIKSNSFENTSQALSKVIEAIQPQNNVILRLPGGRIDLWPDGAVKRELYISNTTEDDTLDKVKTFGFWFEGIQGLTLEGNNTLVVLHGKMVAFGLINCRDVTIKNIAFDYERPTMSEMTILSFSDTCVETAIHADSRFLVDDGKIMFYGEGWKANAHHAIVYNPEFNTMKYSSLKPFLLAKASESNPYRVRFEGDFSKYLFTPGEIITTRDPYRDNCGGFISRSSGITLQNVQMHFMHGLGIVSQFSENITLQKVQVAPRENSGRIISSFADCFHFSGCKGKILIDSCFTSGSHDDPINVHGTHLQITSIDAGKKLTVRFMHHQTYGFEAFFTGDSIAFINPQTLQPVGLAVLKKAKLISKREMELEIAGLLPESVKAGLCIENLTWTPEVTIRNCRFQRTNTRGILLTTRRKILVENNTFYHTGMSAILVADDAASWFESGMVEDAAFTGNHFIDCGYNNGGAVIAIEPENTEISHLKPVHRNIRIENNIFETYDYPIVHAKSVGGLTISGNKIIRTKVLSPMSGNKFTFNLNGCSGVVIMDNSIEGEVLGKNIYLGNMTPSEITLDKKTKTEWKLVAGSSSKQ